MIGIVGGVFPGLYLVLDDEPPRAFLLQTRLVSFLLGTSLLAEAIMQWQFWNTELGPRYEMHARDHFCVNVGVSGGMFLLSSLGAGQYSMDEWLKKND
jgi:uncharacterized membrane protein YphA (DoxX/SURF4 family)